MAGLLVDKLYNPSGVLITDMETHMSHINHNIELNAGQFVQTFFYRCMLWVQQQDCCNKQLFSVSKYYKYWASLKLSNVATPTRFCKDVYQNMNLILHLVTLISPRFVMELMKLCDQAETLNVQLW